VNTRSFSAIQENILNLKILITMEKIDPTLSRWFKCFFGKHEWLVTTDINGDMSRKCIHCNKTQLIYKAHWYSVKSRK